MLLRQVAQPDVLHLVRDLGILLAERAVQQFQIAFAVVRHLEQQFREAPVPAVLFLGLKRTLEQVVTLLHHVQVIPQNGDVRGIKL